MVKVNQLKAPTKKCQAGFKKIQLHPIYKKHIYNIRTYSFQVKDSPNQKKAGITVLTSKNKV